MTPRPFAALVLAVTLPRRTRGVFSSADDSAPLRPTKSDQVRSAGQAARSWPPNRSCIGAMEQSRRLSIRTAAEGVPSESNILRDLFEGLISEAPDGSGRARASPRTGTVSDDGHRLQVHASRPNARWSNGDPVTASDFEFGLRRSVDPERPCPELFEHPVSDRERDEAVNKGEAASLRGARRQKRSTTLHAGNSADARPTPYLLGLLNAFDHVSGASPEPRRVHGRSVCIRGREARSPTARISSPSGSCNRISELEKNAVPLG